MQTRSSLLVLAALLSGCLDSPRTVSGTWSIEYQSVSATEELPADLSGARVRVLVERGAGYRELEGEGFSDGTFRIEEVPPGPYILSITFGDADRVVGSVRADDEVTLVSRRMGRSDSVRPDDPPTVDLAVTNLAPWQSLAGAAGSSDALWLAVPNVAMVSYLPASSVIGQGLERGATELLEPTYAWDQDLVDPAKGDEGYIFQATARTAPISYSAMARFAHIPDLTISDREGQILRVGLDEVHQDHAIDLEIVGSHFKDLIRQTHPEAEDAFVSVDLGAQPSWSTVGAGYAGKLLSITLFSVSDIVGRDLIYGDPFPEDWGRYLRLSVHASSAGSGSSGASWGGYTRQTRIDLLGNGPLGPLVTVPTELSIEGADAQRPLADVGDTPLLSWKPPRDGEVTSYHVGVYQWIVYEEGVTTHYTFRTLVSLWTNATELRMPPGLLPPGEPCFFTVTAYAQQPGDRGTARAVSSLFTP